jgi:hypothetical protein
MSAVGWRVTTFTKCIVLLGFLGCQEPLETDVASGEPAFAAATTEKLVVVFTDEFTQTLACTNEEVAWLGQVTLVIHSTANRGVEDGEGQHFIRVDAAHYTGSGLTSGDTYRYNATAHAILQSPDTDNPFPTTQTLTVREHIIGPDGGIVGLAAFALRFLLSGSGEVQIDTVDEQVTCR